MRTFSVTNRSHLGGPQRTVFAYFTVDVLLPTTFLQRGQLTVHRFVFSLHNSSVEINRLMVCSDFHCDTGSSELIWNSSVETIDDDMWQTPVAPSNFGTSLRARFCLPNNIRVRCVDFNTFIYIDNVWHKHGGLHTILLNNVCCMGLIPHVEGSKSS